MPARRKVWGWIAGVLCLLVALVVLVPYLFRGPIEARVKRAVAARFTAQVDWRRVDLGLIRAFPNLTLRLQDLTVVGTGGFAGDTLLSLPDFGLVLGAGSVFRSVFGGGPVAIRSVVLERPAVRLIVLPDGAANWQIVRPTEAKQASGGGLALQLERLALNAARLELDNRKSGVRATLNGLDSSVRGDFAARQFTVAAVAAADSASLVFAGVPYLRNARLELSADIAVDMTRRLFTIRENQLRLNELVLVSRGSVGMADDRLLLDVSFDSPAAEFRDVLSLVPAVYASSFQTLQASGSVAVNGWVRGTLSRDSFPALSLRAKVANGMFRYPDLPLPARDVAFELAVRNPGGHVDSTVARLEPFHVVLGDDALDGGMLLRTPVSDPDVGVRLNGRLDLANLARTVKLPKVRELSGVIVAAAAMQARLSDVDARRYERVAASGTVAASNVTVSGEALRQPLYIERALLRLTPRAAELPELLGRFGSSDVRLTGSLENLLGFALHGQPLRGQATVRSARFDLNEWRSDDELKLVTVPASLDLALQAAADTVRFGQLTFRNARGGVRVKDGRATLEGFSLDLLGGALVASGWYDTTVPTRPKFDVDLGFTDVDIPAAFSGLRTVQAFAPVAQYAQGRATAQLELSGALGEDMLPVFSALSAVGALATSGLVLRDFPPLDELADMLKVPLLQDPGFVDLKSSFEIRDGRLYVKPFDTRVGQLGMNISGSNGIDRSLDYAIVLALPRSALGTEANRAVATLVAKSGRLGLDLAAADVVTLGVVLKGTVTKPELAVSFRDAVAGGAQAVEQALRQEAERRAEDVQARLDSTAGEARRRAAEEAARLMAAAQEQADAVRAGAKALAETARQEAFTRADSLEARATNPVARVAAKAAADRIRREADNRAAAAVRQAEVRADSIMAQARRRAGLPPDTTGADSVPR